MARGNLGDVARCDCCEAPLTPAGRWQRFCLPCGTAVADFIRIRRINLHNRPDAKIRIVP